MWHCTCYEKNSFSTVVYISPVETEKKIILVCIIILFL